MNFIDSIVDHHIKKVPPEKLARDYRKVSRKFLQHRSSAAFRELVCYVAKNSPFYRRRFAELNIDPYSIKKPRDLGDFYTTPDDIIRNPKEFICKDPSMVFESSGTTGKNKEIYYSLEEMKFIGRFVACGFYIWGVNKKDRVANAFDFSIWIPGMIFQAGLEAAKIFNLTFSKIDPVEVYERIKNYKFSVILGEPTWLIKLTEIAEKRGSFPMNAFIGSAEGMPEAAIPWMKQVWPGLRVIMTYSSVESALALGWQVDDKCDAYHIDDVNFSYEITNPNSDGFGEVTYSTLNRRTMPLLRYRNRDISRLIERHCNCGLTSLMLDKVRGRLDEMVVASGGNLYPLMFEKILDGIEEITKDWQVVFKLNGIREIMEINLESKDNSLNNNPEFLKNKIFDKIRCFYPDLWKNYNIGIFDIDFSMHNPGELRNSKRKLRRLIDERCKTY